MASECEPRPSVRPGDTGPAVAARNGALASPGAKLGASAGRSARFRRPSEFLRAQLAGDGLSAPARATLERYYRNWIASDSSRIAYWYDHQLRAVEALLARLTSPRVLDAGAGTGTESLWFALADAEVTGIDVDPAALRLAGERLARLNEHRKAPLKCRFEHRSILDMSGEFEVVWMEQAFHHMEPRGEVLAQLARLVVPGGHLVFSEANAWNPFIQAALFRLRGRRTVIEHQGVPWGHERVLTPRRLARLLAGAGFDTVACEYFRVFPSGQRFDPLAGLEKALGAGPWQRLVFPMFTHYTLVARRCQDNDGVRR